MLQTSENTYIKKKLEMKDFRKLKQNKIWEEFCL